MIKITSKNLLEFIKAYFSSLGLGGEASDFFIAKTFSEGLVLKLPAVCLVPGNKPAASRSKQTHIHVTGNNRYFFFPQKTVDTVKASTDDHQQIVMVSRQNIDALHGKEINESGLYFRPSHTMTKIACRASQDIQVQISKLRMDGSGFVELRNGLYENDLLVFLKYRDDEKMLAVGIPFAFYNGVYTFESDIFAGLESKGTVTVKNALSEVMSEYSDTDVVDSGDAISDAVYQEMVDAAEASETTYEPVKYISSHPEGKSVKTTRPATNPSIGKEAIKNGRYKCAVDASHLTFRKNDGTIYMEVHHLIPLEQQGAFENKLDTKANLVPVCPLCHKLIHYGCFFDKKPIITRLYEERKEQLKASGLDISLKKMLSFYE